MKIKTNRMKKSKPCTVEEAKRRLSPYRFTIKSEEYWCSYYSFNEDGTDYDLDDEVRYEEKIMYKLTDVLDDPEWLHNESCILISKDKHYNIISFYTLGEDTESYTTFYDMTKAEFKELKDFIYGKTFDHYAEVQRLYYDKL